MTSNLAEHSRHLTAAATEVGDVRWLSRVLVLELQYGQKISTAMLITPKLTKITKPKDRATNDYHSSGKTLIFLYET